MTMWLDTSERLTDTNKRFQRRLYQRTRQRTFTLVEVTQTEDGSFVTGSKRINAQEKLNGTRKRKQSSDKKVASEKSYSNNEKK